MAWNLGAIVVHFRAKTDEWKKAHKIVKADVVNLGREITALGAALTGFNVAVVREFGNFDKVMRESTAVSDVTAKQYEQMVKMTEDMSVKLGMAVTTLGKGWYFLGSAGLSATEQMQSFANVAKLSRAVTVSTGEAAEGLVDIMGAYRVEFEKSTEVSDILVKTVITSNQVFTELRTAMKYIGTAASTMNNSIVETTTFLGLMADAGVKGSKAGTAMRFALTKLGKSGGALSKIMQEMSIDVYNAEKKMRPFIDILGELSEKLKNATEERRNEVFSTMFGLRALPGMLAIFQNTTKEINAYKESLENAAGTMDMVVKKQMMAFLNQMGRLWQWTKRVARSLGEALVPNIQAVIDKVIPIVSELDTWIDSNKKLVATIIKTTTIVGILALVVGPLLILLPTLTKSVNLLAIATIWLSKSLWTLLVKMAAFSVPVLAVVAALLALAAAFYVVRAIWDITWKDMADAFSSFWKYIDKTAKETTTWWGSWATSFSNDWDIVVMHMRETWKIHLVAMQDMFLSVFNVLISTIHDFPTRMKAMYDALGNLEKAFRYGVLGNTPGAMVELLEFKDNMKLMLDPVITNKKWIQEWLGITEDDLDVLTKIIPTLSDLGGKIKDLTVDTFSGVGGEALALAVEDFKSFKEIIAGILPDFSKFAALWRLITGKGVIPVMPSASGGGNLGGGDGNTTAKETWAEKFATQWKDATENVIDGFDGMSAKIETALNDVVSGWQSAIGDFMQLTGTFGDKLKQLMDDIFNSVYQSFVDMVSRIAAEKMFEAILGGGYVGTKYANTSAFNMSSPDLIPVSPSTPFLGAQKPAMSSGGATVNITNSGQPMSAKIASYSIKDREFIINVVAETLETDTQFSESVRGG